MLEIVRTGLGIVRICFTSFKITITFLAICPGWRRWNCFAMVRTEIGLTLLTWLNWFDWLYAIKSAGKLPGPQLFAGVVYRARIETGWRWLDGFSFSWNSPGRRSLWLKTGITSSTTGWRITQFWLHGLGMVRLELVGIVWNPFEMFGIEESVVEDCYHELN